MEIPEAAILKEMSGFLYRCEASLRQLMAEIMVERNPLLFNGLPVDSPELRILEEVPDSSMIFSRKYAYASPWIPVRSDWQTFQSGISSSWRSSLRRNVTTAFLRTEGKPAASQLMLDYGNRLWVLKVGYDETFSRCSPGILLMHNVVREAFERGYHAFEFLGSNEPWVKIWKPELHRNETVRRYILPPVLLISHGW
jgi:hypothetical protein